MGPGRTVATNSSGGDGTDGEEESDGQATPPAGIAAAAGDRYLRGGLGRAAGGGLCRARCRIPRPRKTPVCRAFPVGATTQPAFPGAAGPLSALRSPELKGRTVEGSTSAATARSRHARHSEPDPDQGRRPVRRLDGGQGLPASLQPPHFRTSRPGRADRDRRHRRLRRHRAAADQQHPLQRQRQIEDQQIRSIIDVRPGEAVDPFRIALSRQAIEDLTGTRTSPWPRRGGPEGPDGDRRRRSSRSPRAPTSASARWTSSPPGRCRSRRTGCRTR